MAAEVSIDNQQDDELTADGADHLGEDRRKLLHREHATQSGGGAYDNQNTSNGRAGVSNSVHELFPGEFLIDELSGEEAVDDCHGSGFGGREDAAVNAAQNDDGH